MVFRFQSSAFTLGASTAPMSARQLTIVIGRIRFIFLFLCSRFLVCGSLQYGAMADLGGLDPRAIKGISGPIGANPRLAHRYLACAAPSCRVRQAATLTLRSHVTESGRSVWAGPTVV